MVSELERGDGEACAREAPAAGDDGERSQLGAHRAARDEPRVQADEQHADGAAHAGAQHRSNPPDWAVRITEEQEAVEKDERSACAQAEHGEVERDRRGRLLADDPERDPGAEQLGDEKLAGRREIEADHERDLSEREAVCLASEVDVHGEGLGQEEHETRLHQGTWTNDAGASRSERSAEYRTNAADAIPTASAGVSARWTSGCLGTPRPTLPEAVMLTGSNCR